MNAIKIEKYDMPIVKALSACTDKDSGRPFVQVIHYDKKEGALVATCGKNMLVWRSIPEGMKDKLKENDNYTLDGNYLVAVDTDITYPKWQRVVPGKEGASELDIACYNTGKKDKRAADILGTAACAGVRLNFEYLRPISGLELDKLYVRSLDTAVLAEGKGIQFVIMPIAS